MTFNEYKKTLIYKNYSTSKILLRFIEFKFKNIFYHLILNFNNNKKNKPIINLRDYHDTRFINYLFYSLKNNFNFSYQKNNRAILFLKKIGIKNFLKHTLPENKIDTNLKSYNLLINKKIKNSININTNYFGYINNPKVKNYLVMPYYMYPQIYNYNYKDYFYFKKKFKFKIFFSGGVYKNVYSKFNWDKNGKKLLTRNQILDCLLKEFKNEIFLIREKNDLKDNKIFKKKIIFCLYDKMISKKKYLLNFKENYELLSYSAFSLNCPGVVMPICHHLIESIKLGSIPITPSYDLLNPQLSKKISIQYHNKESLLDGFYKALKMKNEEIYTKRKKLREFYKIFFSPQSFEKNFVKNLNSESPKEILACNDHESIKQLSFNK